MQKDKPKEKRKEKRVAYRTILPWMAHETQYCSFRYIFGTAYSAKTDASEMSPGICPAEG